MKDEHQAMTPPFVAIALCDRLARLPNRGTDGSAAWDLHACIQQRLEICHGQTLKVPTGIRMEIPRGWCGLILPRSSWAADGVTAFSPPIDADYRGEVHIILHNAGHEVKVLSPGDRCAQIVFVPHLTAMRRVEVAELSQTQRGAGGFGSTGGLPQ